MKNKILMPCLLLFISLSAYNQTVTTTDAVNDNGKIFTKTEVEPSFPGGDKAWFNYMSRKLLSNGDRLAANNKPGTVRVRFIVDEEGKISNIEALNMKRSALAKITIRAVATGPEWIPALQNKMPVSAYKEISVTYKTDN